MKRFLLAGLVFLMGCDEVPMAIDISLSAEEGRDQSAILTGCGKEASSGYLFCRRAFGTLPTDRISLIFPKVVCNRKNCIEYQFFAPGQVPTASGAIKMGEARASILLADIMGKNTPLDPDDSDEYPVGIKVWYLRADGEEHTFRMTGFIRLEVHARDYESMPCGSPAMGWKTDVTKECEAQFSTAGRTAVCGDCE